MQTEAELKKKFGLKIRGWRKDAGLTLDELAERTQTSKGLLSKIENGRGNPCVTTLKKLAVALNIDICIHPIDYP